MRRSFAPIFMAMMVGTANKWAAVLLAVLPLASAAWAAETGSPLPYEATRTKPLFSPTRRPPPPALPPTAFVAPPPPVIAPPPLSAPDLSVSGVIVGTGARVAIVKRSSDAAFTRVVPGSQIDGWTVSQIEPRAIILKRDDQSVTIGMPEPPR